MNKKLLTFFLLLGFSLTNTQKSLAADGDEVMEIFEELGKVYENGFDIDSKQALEVLKKASQNGRYYQINGENISDQSLGKKIFIAQYNLLHRLNIEGQRRLDYANNFGRRNFYRGAMVVLLGTMVPYLIFSNSLPNVNEVYDGLNKSLFYDLPKEDIAIVCIPRDNRKYSDASPFFLNFLDLESLYQGSEELSKIDFSSFGYRLNPLDEKIRMKVNKKQDFFFRKKLVKVLKSILNSACQKAYTEDILSSLPLLKSEVKEEKEKQPSHDTRSISDALVVVEDKESPSLESHYQGSTELSLYEKSSHDILFEAFENDFESNLNFDFGAVIIDNSSGPFYIRIYENWIKQRQYRKCSISLGDKVDSQFCHIYPLDFLYVD